ncbi:MAG: zf-HC2 domain-containing protein, partial [Terriglobales bacterium]
MKCKEIRELMPDLAAGTTSIAPQMDEHIQACSECTVKLAELRET